MIASDIVTQLRVLLPQLTDKFTNDISVLSMTRTGTEILVICNEQHGLKVGQAFAITGTDVPIPASITRAGVIGTLVATTNHDLTKSTSSTGYNIGAQTVRITGANEAVFNDTFDILTIPNRKTITFTMADSGASSATGSPVLRDAESNLRDYNSIYEVKEVLKSTQFIFTHSVSGLPNPDGTIVIRTKPRISSGINIERLIEAYTQNEVDKYWMFVVLGDVNASQSRVIESDARSNIQSGADYRQQLIEPFSVYVVIPSKSEIAASDARDEASNLLRPILRSLLFSKFATGLYSDLQNSVQFTGHSMYDYNIAAYIHVYSFEQVADIYEQDTVEPDLDVAFRDIDFSIFLDFGTQVEFMQGTPDLDETPL